MFAIDGCICGEYMPAQRILSEDVDVIRMVKQRKNLINEGVRNDVNFKVTSP